jgi:hypothetical protein
MKLQAKQRLIISKVRKVVLEYKDTIGNRSNVVVTDEKVWAYVLRNPNDTSGSPESLANFMFNSRENGTSAKVMAMKTALLSAMSKTPPGRTGYARDVLDAVCAVTRLTPKSWSIRTWE